MLVYPICLAPGTEAEAAAAEGNYQEGQLSFTSKDGKRPRFGKPAGTSHLFGWPCVEDDVSIDPAGGGYASPTSAVVQSGYGAHLLAVTLAAYSGAYTHKLIMPGTEDSTVAVQNGTLYEIQVTVPASDYPTLEIRNEAAGGTLLWKNAPNGAAHVFVVTLLRKAGAWVFWKSIEVFNEA